MEGFSFSEGSVPYNRGTVVALSEGEGAYFRVTCSPVPWDAHAPHPNDGSPNSEGREPGVRGIGTPIPEECNPFFSWPATPFPRDGEPLVMGSSARNSFFLRKNDGLPEDSRCDSS